MNTAMEVNECPLYQQAAPMAGDAAGRRRTLPSRRAIGHSLLMPAPLSTHLALQRADNAAPNDPRRVVITGAMQRSTTTQTFRHIDLVTLLGRHAISEVEYFDATGCDELEARSFELVAKRWGTTLRSLVLVDCLSLTNAALKRMSASLPRLQYLNLRRCHRVDSSAFGAIAANCTELRKLEVDMCLRLRSASLRSLARGLAATLTEVSARSCRHLGDGGVAELCNAAPVLRIVDISFCARVTGQGLRGMASNGLPRLHMLKIRGLETLADADVQFLVERTRSLAFLDLELCPRITKHLFLTTAVHAFHSLTVFQSNTLRCEVATRNQLYNIVEMVQREFAVIDPSFRRLEVPIPPSPSMPCMPIVPDQSSNAEDEKRRLQEELDREALEAERRAGVGTAVSTAVGGGGGGSSTASDMAPPSSTTPAAAFAQDFTAAPPSYAAYGAASSWREAPPPSFEEAMREGHERAVPAPGRSRAWLPV